MKNLKPILKVQLSLLVIIAILFLFIAILVFNLNLDVNFEIKILLISLFTLCALFPFLLINEIIKTNKNL